MTRVAQTMNTSGKSGRLRIATIAALAKAHGGFGRTALMKLAYFLQTLSGVPLGYQFRLYTYGPYDAQVLEDLKVAELAGAVHTSEVRTPVGMGYAIQPGEAVDRVMGGNVDIGKFSVAIQAIAEEFAGRTAIDLEMASTIIFVDRAVSEKGERSTPQEIAQRVKALKPRLDEGRIVQEATTMKAKGYLTSAA